VTDRPLVLTEQTAAKAVLLVDEGRIVVRNDWLVDVLGDSGTFHRCVATFSGWRCTCPSRTRCSHSIAASIAVYEQKVLRS
jgi:uncharacterized Zn finger protein